MTQAGNATVLPGKDLSGKLVTVLGGSGFIGTHLAQHLLARGARLRIACRHPKRAYRIKPLGNLGQVQFAGCDVTDAQSLARALAGSDAVVNLVGAFAGDLDAVQGRGAGTIARLAREAGAARFIHVSAIGADAESRVPYARTKGEGEAAVREAFPDATIVRPSLVFGPDDSLLAMFGGLIAAFPAMPVFAPQAKLQPVFVDDLAEGLANALTEKAALGQTYEFGGPEVITMLELNQRIAAAQGRERLLIELPDAVSQAIATLTGWLPGAPITRQQWALLKGGNVASGELPGLAELGVRARPLGLFLDRWMVRFRKHGRFGEKAGAGR